MVLEAVYEEDFLPCSFGFRPFYRRLYWYIWIDEAWIVWIPPLSQGLRWVVEIDIVKYSMPRTSKRTESSLRPAAQETSAQTNSCADARL